MYVESSPSLDCGRESTSALECRGWLTSAFQLPSASTSRRYVPAGRYITTFPSHDPMVLTSSFSFSPSPFSNQTAKFESPLCDRSKATRPPSVMNVFVAVAPDPSKADDSPSGLLLSRAAISRHRRALVFLSDLSYNSSSYPNVRVRALHCRADVWSGLRRVGRVYESSCRSDPLQISL